MDKRVVLAIALSVLLMLAYGWLRPPVQQRPAAPGKLPAAGQGTPGAAPAPPGNGAGAPEPGEKFEPREETVRGERLTAQVTSAGGGSIRTLDLWTCPYHESGDRTVKGDPGVVTADVPGRPKALAVDVVGAKPFGLATEHWKLEAAPGGTHASIVRGGLRVEKSVRTTADPWFVEVVARVTNEGARPGDERLLSVHGPWMPFVTHLIPEDGLIVAEVGEDPEQLLPAKIAGELAENPALERLSATGWRYVGVRSDFHLAALLPKGAAGFPAGTAVRFDSGLLPPPPTAPAGSPGIPTAAPVVRVPFVVPAAGESVEWTFRLYAGPNSRKLLGDPASPYAELGDAFPNRAFLFLTFRPIANALAWLLEKIAGLGIGYGLAVCALTILVRGLLFPLSRKSQISMRLHAQKMGKLKPKIDALKEKYAKDPRKMQEMQMKLMREEKVSLLPGGCLLAFLQMPVWISLYATLQTAFEMRHARFLWIADLTGPDRLVEVPWLRGVWGLGGLTDGWFNLLPLLMMATWMISSWMQPLPDDPQQAQTAKMMRWMPLLFGVFLYSTAAGLTLYMTLSALWSIGETWLIRKVWLSKIELAPAAATKA